MNSMHNYILTMYAQNSSTAKNDKNQKMLQFIKNKNMVEMQRVCNDSKTPVLLVTCRVTVTDKLRESAVAHTTHKILFNQMKIFLPK